MTNHLIITALTYILAGMIPALIAQYLFRARFIGGIWVAIIVGLVGAFGGGLVKTFFLASAPDIIPIGGTVDAGPPLIVSIAVTVLFALVSKSNSG